MLCACNVWAFAIFGAPILLYPILHCVYLLSHNIILIQFRHIVRFELYLCIYCRLAKEIWENQVYDFDLGENNEQEITM